MKTDNNELISVIIPAYNRDKTIKECIDSVLNQTYKNIEVIVVDDCSSDKTADIVDGYDDVRVKKCVRLPENHGACYARNFGVEFAKGQYIAFQDSDDIWLPEKLEKQFKYMTEGKYDLVFCGMSRHSGSKVSYYPPYEFDELKDAQKQILCLNCVSTQCIIIKKRIFNDIKFDINLRRYQDWDFAIRASEVANMGYVREALVDSFVQANSITRMVSVYDSLQVIYSKYKNKIESDSHIYANFCRLLGNSVQKSNPKLAKEYFIKSLKAEFSVKMLAKVVWVTL